MEKIDIYKLKWDLKYSEIQEVVAELSKTLHIQRQVRNSDHYSVFKINPKEKNLYTDRELDKIGNWLANKNLQKLLVSDLYNMSKQEKDGIGYKLISYGISWWKIYDRIGYGSRIVDMYSNEELDQIFKYLIDNKIL